MFLAFVYFHWEPFGWGTNPLANMDSSGPPGVQTFRTPAKNVGIGYTTESSVSVYEKYTVQNQRGQIIWWPLATPTKQINKQTNKRSRIWHFLVPVLFDLWVKMAFLRDRSVYCITQEQITEDHREIFSYVCLATATLSSFGACVQLRTWHKSMKTAESRRIPSPNPHVVFSLALADLFACVGK